MRIDLNIEEKLLREIKILKKENALYKKLISHRKEEVFSPKKYYKLFNNAPIPVSIINKSGTTEFVNKIFTKTFGYTIKDIPNSEHWFIKAYPDKSYRNKVISSWKRLHKYKKNIYNETTTFNVTCKSGKVKKTVFRIAEFDSERFLLLLEDISERNEMEAALRKSEEKFRKILENISSIGLMLDLKGRVIFCNKFLLDLTGWKYEEVINKNWFAKFIPGDIRSTVKKIFTDTLQSYKFPEHYENEILTKTGERKVIAWTNVVVFNSYGNIENITSIGEDITEIKKAESALKESEERFKGLFENATVGIYRTSPNGRVLMANPALIKMQGYKSLDEMLNMNVAKSGYVHKEDRIYFQRIMEKFGEIKGFECEWYKADHTRIFIRESSIAVKNKNGKIIYYEGIVEDITDKKRTEIELDKNELRYKTLFNLSPSGIMLADLKGNILKANPAFCQSLGYKPEEIIGKNVKVIAARENRNDIEKNLKLLNEGNILKHTVRDITKTGNIRFMDLHEAKIPLNENEYGILAVTNDITERKSFEEKLIIAKEKAEKSDRLKTEFLAQISHEIRTPINSILSFTSYLHDELKDTQIDDINNIFEIIRKAGNRITRTIDMILNMSELQTGSYEPNFKKIDLFENVIINIAAGFKRQAVTRNINFIIENNASDSITIGDEYTLHQIFDNLINNAFKYTASGKITVAVERNKSGKLFAKISDTGIGISEEFLEQLFEPFSQEEQGYTRKFEGNGLGLALVKKYCEINNVDISVNSKKGVGTTFKLIFDH